MDAAPLPLVPACTLPGAEQPLRAAELEALLAPGSWRVERPAAAHLVLVLVLAASAADAARALVARHSTCCSFFSFHLSERPGSLVVDVRVPASQAGVLDGIERIAGAR